MKKLIGEKLILLTVKEVAENFPIGSEIFITNKREHFSQYCKVVGYSRTPVFQLNRILYEFPDEVNYTIDLRHQLKSLNFKRVITTVKYVFSVKEAQQDKLKENLIQIKKDIQTVETLLKGEGLI